MSGIRPFEGSDESSLTPYNVSNTTEEVYYYDDDGSSTTNTRNTTSVADLPSLLPLWAWAAMLVCTILLLSMLVNCIILTVGWRKQRKTNQMHQRTRSHKPQTSSMWIDLENTELSQPTQCMTDGQTPKRETRNSSTTCRIGHRRSRSHLLQGTREKRSLIFSEEELAIMKSKLRRTRDNINDDQHLSEEGCKHQATNSLRLNSSFLHLQPATSSTFKRDNSQADIQKLDLCDTHTDKTHKPTSSTFKRDNSQAGTCKLDLCDPDADETHKLSAVHLATASSTPEKKVDTCLEMDEYHEHQLPEEQHILARNLESSTNTRGHDEQTNVSESTQRSNYFDDISNITVSTFSHYAFNTL